MEHASIIYHCSPFDDALPTFGNTVLVMGVFDGVHLGHRALFAQARQESWALGLPLLAITFERDPDELFLPFGSTFGKLLSNQKRLEMIAEQARGGVISLSTTQELFAMSPAGFLRFLETITHPKAIFTGSNFRFGAKARGTADDLAAWAKERGSTYIPFSLIEDGGAIVSATRIRNELRLGNTKTVRRLLGGRPHSITARVEQVHKAGRGLLAAELDLSGNEVMLPLEGDYAVSMLVDEVRLAGIANVDDSPSFTETSAPTSIYFLDFERVTDNTEITIEFGRRICESRAFDSRQELLKALAEK